MKAVKRSLAEPMPLGYSVSGQVMTVAPDVAGIRPGELVAAGGGGYAIHSDVVAVPKNLVVRVPEGVSPEEAAFATLGSVSMHGVRLSEVSLGSTIVVVGLGLIGLLAGVIARAAGCRVLGIDVRDEALQAAMTNGFSEVAMAGAEAEALVSRATGGRGADAVLVCAASSSGDPLIAAAAMARDRAKVVIVGDMPLAAPRAPFFEKELEVVVSRSYGPGRYDPTYEEKGNDYPIGYVRWTEQRNMEAFLNLIADRSIDLSFFTQRRYDVEEAPDVYDSIAKAPGAVAVLDYGSHQSRAPISVTPTAEQVVSEGALSVGLIGTGSFAQRILVPALLDAGASLTTVASLQGRAATDKWGAARPRLAESPQDIFSSSDVDTVVIATRHDSHAELAAEALKAGKHVFVEKPLALSYAQLESVVEAWRSSGRHLQVGFNRRFAPMTTELRSVLQSSGGPHTLLIRVNAGSLPDDHWMKDLDVGGGRVLGEMCHFLDLGSHLVDSHPVEVVAASGGNVDSAQGGEEVTAVVRYDDGSVVTVLYSATGGDGLPKERIEAFSGGKAYAIDDWERWSGATSVKKSGRSDDTKGHRTQVRSFVETVRGGRGAEGLGRSIETTLVTLGVVESIATGVPIHIPPVAIEPSD